MAIMVLPTLSNVQVMYPVLRKSWRSSFLGIMQVQPGLNIVAVAETRFFLRLSELLARLISPTTFSKKCIPDGNFLVARPPATDETPFEDFLVRSTLQRSLHELVVIHSEKSRATRVEVGRILNTGKILGR